MLCWYCESKTIYYTQCSSFKFLSTGKVMESKTGCVYFYVDKKMAKLQPPSIRWAMAFTKLLAINYWNTNKGENKISIPFISNIFQTILYNDQIDLPGKMVCLCHEIAPDR